MEFQEGTALIRTIDGGTLEIDDSTLTALLHRWPVGRLGTVTPDGAPHVLPVVFVAAAGWVYSPIDAKRKAASKLARVRNIQAHGRATLLLDDYGEDWSRLWWVRLDGEARVVTGGEALLEDMARRLRGKYPQYREIAPYSGAPTLLAVRWDRVSAWSQAGDVAPLREAAGLPRAR